VSPLQSPTGECYVRLRFSWRWVWRMPSSGMLHRLILVRTD
jgi:hypothetical protein